MKKRNQNSRNVRKFIKKTKTIEILLSGGLKQTITVEGWNGRSESRGSENFHHPHKQATLSSQRPDDRKGGCMCVPPWVQLA